MKSVFSIRYDHPVEKVWPFLSEPERWMDYVPALVERTRLDSGPVVPGSTWRSVAGRIRWLGLMPDALTTRIYRNDMKTLARVLDTDGSE